MNRLRELVGIVRRDDLAVLVEKIAVAVLLEDGAEDPAVAVVIGELRVLQLRIQLGDLLEEIQVAPQSARRGGLGVLQRCTDLLLVARVVLLLRVHELAVGLLVPPGVAEVRIHEAVALVHVTDHALAARDRGGELVLDWVAALVLRDGWVHAVAEALVAVLRIPAGIERRAIVRVDHVHAVQPLER